MDLTLISIVVGLGLTELLLTFYRLVQARRRVTWDPLPLAWALLILVAVVNYWWGIRASMAGASGLTTGEFMLVMMSPIFSPAAFAFSRAPSVEFLPNSASLPTMATVIGFGFCSIATAKKPRENSRFGSGPSGIMEK